MSEERHVWLRGSYTITSDVDYDNFTADVITDEQRKMNITAANGYLVLEYNSDMTFKRRQLKDIPDPLDSTDGYQGDDNGDDNGDDDGDDNGDDNGGDNYGYIGEITPYFPAQYADKTIAAWYLTANLDDNQVKIQAVFLFTDNTLVKTTSKFYSVNDGREPDYRIEGEGRYEIKDGDYSNGMASVVLSDGTTFDVTIEEGLMFAMNEYFAIQDNADLPAPIKAK